MRVRCGLEREWVRGVVVVLSMLCAGYGCRWWWVGGWMCLVRTVVREGGVCGKRWWRSVCVCVTVWWRWCVWWVHKP